MENQEKNENKWLVPASILVAGIVIAGAIVYSNGLGSLKGQEANVAGSVKKVAGKAEITNGDAVLGNSNAPITVIEFGDFQCPFCAKYFKEVEGNLVKDFVNTGKVKMVYKPLAFLDSRSSIKESQNSVVAVKCAQDQGKYWEMHNAIFSTEYNEVMAGLKTKKSNENNGNLNFAFFKKIASGLNMNTADFEGCYNSAKYKNVYQDYMNQAKVVMPEGIGTPAVFINGNKYEFQLSENGEFDYQSFAQYLNGLLQK